MAFRRSRSLYDRERNRPTTPSAEGYLGPKELRDISRSPIVTAGDEEDDEEENAESEESYKPNASSEGRPSKSILKVYMNIHYTQWVLLFYQNKMTSMHVCV